VRESSQIQIAQRRAPSASDTKAVAPDGDRQAGSRPDAGTDPISSTVLVIPGFAFDFAKIASRASLLFPFLDLQLSIQAAPEVRLHDGGDGLVFVQTITAHRADKLPRLRVSPTELQTIVDLAWSRRARWKVFQSIRTITDGYDPNEGRLPTLLRAYVDEDLLQPYQDTTIRDPRLWTQLGIAADHADFIQFITGYAARHPSTRVTTELLFLLDKLAQASLDALMTLLDTEPTRDLRAGLWRRTGMRID